VDDDVEEAADNRSEHGHARGDEPDGKTRQRLLCHESLENVHSMWMKKEE
jgi:hypothetical protein